MQVIKQQLTKYLQRRLPARDHRLNRELIQLLVKLDAPKIVPRMLKGLKQAVTAKHQLDYALALSAAKQGWKLKEQRKQYFDWLETMTDSKGGHSYFRLHQASSRTFY